MSIKPWPDDALAFVGGTEDDPWFRKSEGAEQRTCYNCGCTIWLNILALTMSIGITNKEYLCISCYKLYRKPKTLTLLLRDTKHDS